MEPRDRAAEAVSGGATSRLRIGGYCLLLTAFAFVQQPGRMVGDTKFDLVVDPARFLARAFGLWDPQAAFGQVQNQAYGYFWPMGPFFLAGHLVGMPGWMVQRLWWSLLLSVAFVGVVLLARALRIGGPGGHVLAGFAYALSAHLLTLLGPTSVEAWPSAVAPWVLLPLVRGAERGSARRAAALSALAVAMCGGVNAVAVAAVLPTGAVWLLTRTAGRRRRALLTWWPALTVAATLWWSLPLLLLARYGSPFLDYIENAPVTTTTTGLPDVLAGTSDWVAYASPHDWLAGYLLGSTPLLIVDAAVVAALGLAGIARRDNPHGRFLLLSVLAGVVLVGFGYDGAVHGWLAPERQGLLDGPLAPFRNLHKFDTVLRLPLALGLAHLVSVFRLRVGTGWADRTTRTGILLAAVFSVAGVAIPAYSGQLAPPASVERVPAYWRQAADYLAAHRGDGTALELPAAAFGDYLWGSPHDDVMQGLARSPWAVRNVIPLAQPGNVRMLDAVTRATELGRPDSHLADYLASNGIGYLVVRNDLEPFRTGAPDPVVLHQALDRSPGLRKVAWFGPQVGDAAGFRARSGVRVANDRGRRARYPAVEIYQVGERAPAVVTAWAADSVPVLVGGPAARMDTDAAGVPAVLAGDARRGRFGPTVLTDGLRRRETAFTSVRHNESATMTAGEAWRLRSVEHNHRVYRDMARWETVVRWRGIAQVTASSAQAYADALPPLDRGRSPSAALDGDAATSFSTASLSGATGQWWRARLDRPRRLGSVTVTLGRSPRGRVSRLELVTGAGRRVVPAPAPGRPRHYALPRGSSRFLEVRAAAVRRDGLGAQLVLAEVRWPRSGVSRALATPRTPFPGAPAEIVLARDPTRPACASVDGTTTCDDSWRTSSEDGDTLDRVTTLGSAGAYEPELSVLPREGAAAERWLAARLPVTVTSSRTLSADPAAGALAAVDQDTGTTWVADARDPRPHLDLTWSGTARLRSIDLVVGPDAAAARPTLARLVAGGTSRLVRLDRHGAGSFRPLTTDHLRIELVRSTSAYSFERGGAVRLPVGVSEVRLPGAPALASLRPYEAVDLGCGSGPRIGVGNRSFPTSVSATPRQLLAGVPIRARLCRPGPLALRRGASAVSVSPSTAFVPQQLTLRSTSGTGGASAAALPVSVLTWQATNRSVHLPARHRTALIVVNENLNPGWRAVLDGHPLRVQRVDGWRQGWLVPPGPAGTVELRYAPCDLYRGALLGGGLAVVLVLLVALRRDTSSPPPERTAAGGPWVGAAVLLGVAGLLAGWPGLVVAAVVIALRARLPEAPQPSWSAAGLVGAAGGVMALLRDGGFVAGSATAQTLACLGLAAAAWGTNGPAFLNRRAGRSNRW